jgi:hypothetical protein
MRCGGYHGTDSQVDRTYEQVRPNPIPIREATPWPAEACGNNRSGDAHERSDRATSHPPHSGLNDAHDIGQYAYRS